MGRTRTRNKSKSKLKQLVTLAVIAALCVIVFKVIFGASNTFNIESDTSEYESTAKKRSTRVTDTQGHTNEFWTEGRFKW